MIFPQGRGIIRASPSPQGFSRISRESSELPAIDRAGYFPGTRVSEILRSRPENPARVKRFYPLLMSDSSRFLSITQNHGAAQSLLLRTGRERIVFRAVVLLIVLTVAAGPSFGLVCATSCSPEAAAADKCEDQGLTLAPVVREDIRRSVYAPEADRAVLTPQYHFANSTVGDRYRQDPRRESSIEKRPLSTNLRI